VRAPPDRVIRAFGMRGTPEPLTGGRGTAWRVGSRVFKPADVSYGQIEWQAEVLAAARPQGVRLVLPLRSVDGTFVVAGWMATPFVEAVHEPGRWLEILTVGRRLVAALADVPRPAFLDARRTHWDVADRMAWGDEPLDRLGVYPHIDALARLRSPVQASAQVIHGDLTGNVLFAKGLVPAVIDFAAYWRPAAYAGAIVVADALVWEGAPDDVVTGLEGDGDAGQFLVRALLFRALVEVLRNPGLDPEAAARPFSHAVAVAQSVVIRSAR
jgi:uncharacterized protein (TIGR02569 family)